MGVFSKFVMLQLRKKIYIHIYTLHWPLTESGTIAVSFLNSPVEYDKTKH